MFEFYLSKKIKKRKVKTYFKEDIEPQEIFLDFLAQKKERELGVPEKKIETPLSKNVLRGFFIFIIFINFLFFIRTFQFQIIEGKNLTALSEKNKFTIYQLKAGRGVIYDRKGNQLVWNRPSFDLSLNKKFLPSSETEKIKIFKEVSQILNINYQDIKNKILENENEDFLIAENIDHEKLIVLETRISEFPGFQIINNPIREYIEGKTFAHLIGFTHPIRREELQADPEFYSIRDYVGREGLEIFYERVLRRNPGKFRVERDARGNIISQEIIQYPQPGKSLVLFLDSELQRKAKEELEKKYNEIGARGAVIVAMDPRTGGILSLVSLPSFDNNLFQKGADPQALQKLLKDPQRINPLFNRAISGRYLTGSTIKSLLAAAVLEEGIISPEKKLYGGAYIEIPHQYNPEISYKFRNWTIHGWTDIRKAIAQSCNVYFYTVGGGYGGQRGLGPTRIKKYLELFGWGDRVGIDLPGEAIGFIPSIEWKRETLREGWWDGDTYHLSIGQGFLQVTPLAMTASYVAIANGGKLLQPQIVHKIVEGSGDQLTVLEEKKPKIIRQNFINPKNIEIVREGMRQAVTGFNSPQASAVILNSLPVSAGAKTGTAELGQNRFHNWVVVFAPYENPEIVLTVMFENVQGLQAAALPVAKEVLEWFFSENKNE